MSEFENNVILIYGEIGKNWLKNLPILTSDLASQWNLRDLVPCENLTYNYVMAGWQADVPVILKIGIDIVAITQECNAIQAFNGYGLIQLLDSDLDKGAILIIRAVPGKTLITLFPRQDKMALEISCKLISVLHSASIPTEYKFPLLSEWLSIIDKNWDLPIKQLQLARKLKNDLLNNSQNQVLLHGDVHYANILSNGDSWVFIDPKGVIGDPLYDMTGCLLREPFEQVMKMPSVEQLLMIRMKLVAEYAKTDMKKIWAWTYVQTVMSICWSLEDGQDVSLKRKCLDILYVMPAKLSADTNHTA